MKLGVAVRTMGPQSSRATLTACVDAAEAAGLSDVWVQDHLAIPPDDAEGSGGRYLDPLTTLAFLAARTERIALGTGVLNLPYRAALPTAKALATVQELSQGRLLLGVGVGWMRPEFQALGVDRTRRGRLTDEALAFFHDCFAHDEVEANGQRFLFLPRPNRPPIYIGGAPPHALERVVRHGDGWLPMGGNAEALKGPIARLQERAADVGRPPLEVRVMTALPLDEPSRAVDQVAALREVGVTGLIQGLRYDTAQQFADVVAKLREHVLPLCGAGGPAPGP